MEQTVKKKFGIRDIMTIAAMMVITYLVAMVIGSVTLPFPVVYLYGSAGIDAFIGAIFYLVAANRVNKHGLLFAWAAGRHGLYVPDSIFPGGSTHCRANHDWQGYIPQCCPQPDRLDGKCHRQLCRLRRTAVVGVGQLSGNGCKQRV